MISTDSNDCSVYAVAAVCGTTPDDARYYLWRAGRDFNDGATDKQISLAIRELGCRMRRVQTDARTVRSFALQRLRGSYLVTTTDHVVAVVDGYLTERISYPDMITPDLARIEKVHKILFD